VIFLRLIPGTVVSTKHKESSSMSSLRSRATLILSVAVGLLLVAPGASLAATPAPRIQVSSEAEPSNLIRNDPHGEDQYRIIVTNVGDAATDNAIPLLISDALPPGVTAVRVRLRRESLNSESGQCTTAPVRCTYPASTGLPPLQPEEELVMTVAVRIPASVKEGALLTNEVTVSGGGAPDATVASTDPVAKSSAPFGIHGLEVSDFAPDGSPATQAGAHPRALTTTVSLSKELFEHEEVDQLNIYAPAGGDARTILTELPPGFIGNPRALPQCSLVAYAASSCPADTQIGIGTVHPAQIRLPILAYNLPPFSGQVAAIGLDIPFGPRIILVPTIRTGGDYGLRVITSGLSGVSGINYINLTIWGVPAAASHDVRRGGDCGLGKCGVPSDAQPPVPYLTNPTSCPGTPLHPSVLADSWQHPGTFVSAFDTWPAIDGCNQVPFEPSLKKARPTTNLADFPSGLDVDLHLPLNGFEEPEATSESNLKDATVTLPPGLLVNPSSAAGLEGCSLAQIDLKGEGPATCPDASKLGNIEVDTPLLDHPLPGAVYLAKQGENPFNSLLAIYIAVDDPATGVVVKLAGHVQTDPQTGQLTTTFEENPQLPFEDFKLHFFGGATGALRTPPTCGTYTTTFSLTPWSAPESGPPATPHDEFTIVSPPSGSGACPRTPSEEPNAPTFHAGTESPQAATYSPFSLKLVREDGSQEIKGIDTALPPGLTGKLAGVGECSEAALAAAADPHRAGAAEQASPSCPASSEVGTVDVAAGAGPTPLNVSGRAYLAGPYKSAPLSLAIITPAVAGPFDLGTVVVRTALNVDPSTAQIHAVSDPIPTILEGIPLDVRSITVKASRPNFTLNPTNCEPLAFSGSALSVLGSVAPLSQRFQVGGCSALPFKPKLALSLKGSTKRGGHPALKAVLKMKPGEANIAKAQVTLPPSEYIDNAHFQDVCTRVQLAANACPKKSIYGHARAITPLLDHPLEGPVYLGTGYGNKLPDLLADLNGQIHVILNGKVDSVHKSLRSSFEVVPDAPVSKFVLEMQGAKKGLLETSENICSPKARVHATVSFTGQNGKVSNTTPAVGSSCGKAGVKHGKRRHG
jgi:hypothetical protein